MKRKLLKQMSTQWRSNVWLVVELMIISVVMWYIVDLLTIMVRPMLEPNGFDVENCYKISYNRSGELKNGEKEMTPLEEFRELVKRLRRYPGVEGVALSNALEPYCGNFQSSGFTDVDADSTKYGGVMPSTRYGFANADFIRVFRIEGLRGESPEELADMLAKNTNQMLIAENFYLSTDSAKRATSSLDLLGHRLTMGKIEGYKVAAVLKNVKREDTTPLEHYSFILFSIDDETDEGLDRVNDISIRVRPDAVKGFEKRFRDDMSKQFHIGLTYLTGITSYDDVKAARAERETKIKSKLYIVAGFLLLNVFLGLLGTFWYRTRQRVSEIAVRMTFGATRRSVFRRLVSEGIILLVIATVLAAIIDCLMAYFELNVREDDSHFTCGMMAWTIGVTFLISLVVIVLGVYFPARYAMRVEPATALHDE